MRSPLRNMVAVRLSAVRWELACLLLPLARGALYVFGFSPPQLNESMLNPVVQAFALIVLAAASLLAMVGVLRQDTSLEKAGLRALAPSCLVYASMLMYADWRQSLLSLIVYIAIAGAAVSRAVEIVKANEIAAATVLTATGELDVATLLDPRKRRP